jgi:DNA-binding MarR family transcriptional regulator
LHYSNRKINKLIPEELMMILRHINNSRIKGMMINQTKMRELLKITKPTLKKRLDALLETGYISFEQVGNHRYLKLTTLGESVLN